MKYDYETMKPFFKEHANFSPTEKIANNLMAWCKSYELRGEHPTALNSPYIGLAKMYFLPEDQQVLFDELDCSRGDIARVTKNVHIQQNIGKVAGDPYNLLTIWAVHKFMTSSLSDKLKFNTSVALLKMLHYKFFTSRVNHLFPHGANEDTIVAAVENLSGKYIIKQRETGTWRLLMTKRSEDIISKDSIHKQAIKSFEPDKAVFYVISDTQTRLRSNLKLITDEYYKTREEQERVGHYAIMDEIDGDVSMRSVEFLYDQMSTGISTAALSTDSFINSKYVDLTCKLGNNSISPEFFRRFLSRFSDVCVGQHKAGKGNEIKGSGQEEELRGYRVLIAAIISKTYTAVLQRKDVNPKSKLSILEKTISMYKASRISDEGIVLVKNNVDKWVLKMDMSKREETLIALRLSMITYIILMSFDYQ